MHDTMQLCAVDTAADIRPTCCSPQCFVGHTGAVRCGAFTPDGKAVVTGGGAGDASLKVWDPKTGACGTTYQGHGFHEAGGPGQHFQLTA